MSGAPKVGWYAKLRCEAADWIGIGRGRISVRRKGGSSPTVYVAVIEGKVQPGDRLALAQFLNERVPAHILFTVEAEEEEIDLAG